MKIRINNRLHLDNLSEQERTEIIALTTYPNPAFHKAQRLQKSTRYIPETLCLADCHGEEITLPRGVIADLLQAYPGIEIVDETVSRPVAFTDLHCEYRAYQERAVESMTAKMQGVLVAPCGGGKTNIALETIRRCGQRALILVHTTDLSKQWVDRVESLFDIDIEPGIISGGKWREGEHITIATIQSLNRKLEKDFIEGYGMILQDECHHVPAYTFNNVISQFPAAHRYGVSATPDRADGLSFLLFATMGPILHRITDYYLEQAGIVLVPTIRVIETETSSYSGNDHAEVIKAITGDDRRNDLIIRHISAEARKGHSCLVLSDRIEHGQILNCLFQATGLPSAHLSGQDTKQRRDDVLNDVSSGKTLVLFASKIADEGLDVPRLSRLFLTCPTRNANAITQRIGRIKRPHPSKPAPIVYDYLDVNIGLAVSQFRARQRQAYEGLDIETIKTESDNDNRNIEYCTGLSCFGACSDTGKGGWIESAGNTSMEGIPAAATGSR